MDKKNLTALFYFVIVVIVLAGFSWGGHKLYETPQFCGQTCHIMNPYYETYTDIDSNKMAAQHAESGVTCIDCHKQTVFEQLNELTIFITGNYELPLKTRTFKNEFCFDCHEYETKHKDYEEVKQTTAIWVEEFNRNPHASPHYPDLECHICHMSHQDSSIFCSQCHLMPHLGNGWEKPVVPENPIP